MAFLYLVRLAWRGALYLIYGVIAIFIYNFLFSLEPPLPGYGALSIVILAILKDSYDFLLGSDGYLTRVSYKFVEHNPFNILLIWGILTEAYTIADPTIRTAVLAGSGFNILFDGYFDVKKEPSPLALLTAFGIVVGSLFIAHQVWGHQTVINVILETSSSIVSFLPIENVL